jgi:hypothetical protein
MNAIPFIPKEIPDMPDAYGVEISLFGGRATKYEIISHRLIDKLFHGDTVLAHAAPYWEFVMQANDELLVVPFAAATVKFDIRWFKICELKNEFKKKNEVANGD